LERIGDAKGIFSHDWGNKNGSGEERHIPDHYSAVNLAIEALKQKISLSDIKAVGFKVVLAKGVTGCVELNKDVLKAMEEYLPLAPVHNSVYLSAISVFQRLLPGIPLVGLFETSFHKDIPPQAFLYGIPWLLQKYGIRKYGFSWGLSPIYLGIYRIATGRRTMN
jgi:acetate kinase